MILSEKLIMLRKKNGVTGRIAEKEYPGSRYQMGKGGFT